MAYISTSKARQEMKDIINRVAYGKERIYLTSHDKKMVAIIPLEDAEILDALEDAQDIRIAKERIAKAKKDGTLSIEEFEKELKPNV